MQEWRPAERSETDGRRQPEDERGGVHQFCTPSWFVRCLVEMLAPFTKQQGEIQDLRDQLKSILSEALSR